MNIKSNLENQFFRRHEIILSVESLKTPTFTEMQTQLADEVKTDKELVAVKSIKGGFGSNKFVVSAFVYSNAEDKKRFEPKPKVKKGTEAAVPALATPAAVVTPTASATPAAPVAVQEAKK
jgi:ribosomal protein S24E